MAAERGEIVTCDRSTVSRWLAGVTPRPPAPSLLVEALSRRLGRPVSAVEAGLSLAPYRVLDLEPEADAVRKLSALTRIDLDPHRRSLLTTQPFSLGALAWAGASETSFLSMYVAPPSPANRAGQSAVEEMQAMVSNLFGITQLRGGDHVRTVLATYIGQNVLHHLNNPAPTAVHANLLSQAARLTLLLGNSCVSAGFDALAQRYHHAALQLATEASDADTLAIALRTMSTHAHSLGHQVPAVRHLAEQAVEVARHAPFAVRAYSYAQLAVVRAKDDRRAAVLALTEAEKSYERADTTPGPFTHYPPGALYYQRAQVLASMRDLPGAVNALTASLRLRAPSEHQVRALTRSRLAELLLAQGSLDAALSHWHVVLDDYPALRSHQIARRLVVMQQRLRPHRLYPPVATLLARAAGRP
ncbi:hypothetical protein [Streptomyces sp. NPDC058486]|uniref:hypothetical protein n=1 Tax=unclassified Streptomyces TaxID=2593676 RepID=UPI0036657A0E